MKTFTAGQPVEIRHRYARTWVTAVYTRAIGDRHEVLADDGFARVPDGRIREGWSGMCPANLHGLDYKGQACDLCAPTSDDRRAIAERILLADLEDDDLSARIESGAVRNDDGSVTLTVRVTIPADRIDATMRAAREAE